MTTHALLIHPLTYIVGLCLVLVGIGAVSPSYAAHTPINIYAAPAPRSQAQATQTTRAVQNKQVTNSTGASNAARTTTIPPKISPRASSKHYSVPASLRGDGGERGERGDGGGYDN